MADVFMPADIFNAEVLAQRHAADLIVLQDRRAALTERIKMKNPLSLESLSVKSIIQNLDYFRQVEGPFDQIRKFKNKSIKFHYAVSYRYI